MPTAASAWLARKVMAAAWTRGHWPVRNPGQGSRSGVRRARPCFHSAMTVAEIPDQTADAEHQILHQSQGVDEQDRNPEGRAEEALGPVPAEQPERQEKKGSEA